MLDRVEEPRRPLRRGIKDRDAGPRGVVEPQGGQLGVALVLLEPDEATTERQRGEPSGSGSRERIQDEVAGIGRTHAGTVR